MKSGLRRINGQSIAELAAGMLVFVPIILLLIDCAVIMIGVSTNEAVCRDACRAASAGPPASTTAGSHTVSPGSSPYKRALKVIKDVYAAGGFVKINETMSISESLQNPLPQAPMGGPYIGLVTVETTADIAPPFLIRVFVENGTYQFKNTQRYPYTYVMPSS